MSRLSRHPRRSAPFAALLAVFAAAAPASAQQIVSTAAELQAAIAAANSGSGSATILVQDGVYALTQFLWITRDGLTLRGQSGNPAAAVLEGSGMTSGITHLVQVAAHDVTVEDLTLRRVMNHAVQVHGEGPYSADRTVLRNLVLQDTGQQMVKVSYKSGTASSADFGVVEGCLFEYTAGIGPQYYIGGIDAHQAQNWVVRGCTFRGIRSPDASVAEHAVHFWSGAGGTIVERNLIVNCDRGIGFGLGTRGHNGGVIRNNMIYHADLGADRADVSIELESATGAEVVHNTIYQEHAYQTAISVRWAASTATVANNLVRVPGGGSRIIWARDGATVTQSGNVVGAQASWFVDVPNADLHVTGSVPAVLDAAPSGGVTDDFDGEARPQGAAADVGADEVAGATGGGSGMRQVGWGQVKANFRF
ncbi:MAG: right-handed parallel beta-helix repeat-containing protein [Candidatus Eiseniibacteriota bacterium]